MLQEAWRSIGEQISSLEKSSKCFSLSGASAVKEPTLGSYESIFGCPQAETEEQNSMDL